MQETQVSVRDGMFEIDVLEGGGGDPLLYLHGIGGLEWDGCLERLSADRRVIAPRLPGFGGSTGNEHLQDVHDLTYFYLDLLDAMDLHDLPVVGHSLGGMVAAELACVQPRRFSRLVLVSAFGLWNEAHPGLDIFGSTPGEIASALFHDADSNAARAVAGRPRTDAAEAAAADGALPQELIDFMLERAKAMSTAAKYLWPIPNKGLKKRLHRATQPALLLWGTSDGITPPALGEDFRALLAGARLEVILDAAHMAPGEQPERVAELIGTFLDGV